MVKTHFIESLICKTHNISLNYLLVRSSLGGRGKIMLIQIRTGWSRISITLVQTKCAKNIQISSKILLIKHFCVCQILIINTIQSLKQ